MRHCMLLLLTVILLLPNFAVSEKNAYVSVLSSDDFLISARVLAHRLKKLNATIPYIIIVTEDVSESSIEALKEENVIIQKDHKIDTPYINTHKAKKYQYTKIWYWKMVEYDVLVHLDLDVLPLVDISILFQCGTFCASIRHSDMFNSGVFVLKPNETVYNDMERKRQSEFSYDGGDQGFLNSYFEELKFAPMFDHKNLSSIHFNASIQRLSAVFNYDIGMYYLNGGRFLVEPLIIHYTMGPTKPWLWWGYPLFDLNWQWLEARCELEDNIDSITRSFIRFAIFHGIFIFTLIVMKRAVECVISDYLILDRPPSRRERFFMGHAIYFFTTLFCLRMTPTDAHPLPSWFFFSGNTAWMTAIFSSLYIKLRSGQEPDIFRSAGCILVCVVSHTLFWLAVVGVSTFQRRVFVFLSCFVIQQILVVWYTRIMIFNRTLAKKPRYQALKVFQSQD